MSRSVALDLDILNRYIDNRCGGKEIFFGCWSLENLALELGSVPDGLQMERGENWFAVRNGANQVDGLLFPKETESDQRADLVIHRGYLADAALHSYSEPESIRDYWSGDLKKRHNGIFSAVVINDDEKSLKIITDVFGVGPVFYREIGEKIFFSSTPALLSLQDDEMDLMSWALRKKLGHVPGDATLSQGVKKVSPAAITTFDKNGMTVKNWYDYSNFASGEKPVDDDALAACETSFSTAMEKCRKIEFGEVKLPLSSGYDSRRIFAHLQEKSDNFETLTVQMPTAEGEDVDGVFAPQMSKDFGYSNKLFKIPTAKQWHEFDNQRLFSLDAQTDFHTWSVRIFNYYRGQNISIYDGLGGDVMGFYGWNFVYNPEQRLSDKIASFLNKDCFPTFENIKLKMNDLYEQQPSGINRDILSFCLWQSRCGTSIWAQQQSLPGQLVFCPYFDLEYIETMLSYSVEKGLEYNLQREVLQKFWPKLASYKGSGDLPDRPKKLGRYNELNKTISLRKFIVKTIGKEPFASHYKKLLTPKAIQLLVFAKYSDVLTDRISWWARHVVEMVYWWNERPFVIKVNDDKNDDE